MELSNSDKKFTLRSGNNSSFKQMGSSPAKKHDGTNSTTTHYKDASAKSKREVAFSKRHDKNYTYGVNTAGTAEQGRGQKMYVDADGNSIEMNERRFLQNI